MFEDGADAEDEQKQDAEKDDAAERRAALDEEYSIPLQTGGLTARGASGTQAAGGGISKEEAEKLLDAKKLMEVMSHKDELLKRLKVNLHPSSTDTRQALSLNESSRGCSCVVGGLQRVSLVLSAQPQRDELSSKLRALALALIDRNLVKNKSTEARAIAACCIADLFRIVAPHPPYGEDRQLKIVFELFTALLSNLAAPTHPDFNRYFALLEALVNVQFASVLCNRSTECDNLMHGLFELFFALAKVSIRLEHSSHSTRATLDACAHSIPLLALCFSARSESHDSSPLRGDHG